MGNINASRTSIYCVDYLIDIKPGSCALPGRGHGNIGHIRSSDQPQQIRGRSSRIKVCRVIALHIECSSSYSGAVRMQRHQYHVITKSFAEDYDLLLDNPNRLTNTGRRW